ncbi:hypothetical protein SKAU_G00104200 [Synaphobranchus kaupii]|uniref:Uncharacterized protein n=1 Tax=Synaphobranchus kaupii TaxID=118154 RepID=A0A9Q1FZD1_SYNKA|nr:hypothetical protein SKAU_G00104200 [Synaphobranchus kaupii]
MLPWHFKDIFLNEKPCSARGTPSHETSAGDVINERAERDAHSQTGKQQLALHTQTRALCCLDRISTCCCDRGREGEKERAGEGQTLRSGDRRAVSGKAWPRHSSIQLTSMKGTE